MDKKKTDTKETIKKKDKTKESQKSKKNKKQLEFTGNKDSICKYLLLILSLLTLQFDKN